MIRAIAFDFGGTLFSTEKMGRFTPSMSEVFITEVVRALDCSRAHGELIFEAFSRAWKARRARADELPEKELNSLDLLQTALAETGGKLDRGQMTEVLNSFHSKESEQFSPLKNVVESLPILAAHGYRLFIVSNNPWSESIRACLRRYNIESCFEQVIVSCDVGFRKPHRKIFEVLLKHVPIPVSEILFVGDSFSHDIVSPQQMGLMTCLVDFEGINKNSQRDRAGDADLFLTQFEQLLAAVEAST